MTRDLSIQVYNSYKILTNLRRLLKDHQNVENFYLNFEYIHMYITYLEILREIRSRDMDASLHPTLLSKDFKRYLQHDMDHDH